MILYYFSKFLLILGSFFILASIVGLIRYKDFYIKLHTLNMFNIYGVSPILFSIGISSKESIIFFEILFLIIVNIICSIVAVNILFRNAILNNIKYKAKTRDDILEEEMKELENRTYFGGINITKDDLRRKTTGKEIKKLKEKAKKKEEKQNKSEEKNKKLETKKIDIEEKIEKKSEKTNTEEIDNEDSNKQKSSNKSKKEKKGISDIEKENNDLKEKIKEQKKILRKKIETVRKNAFITRKPEEIQKAEDLIKSILDKYHLTEEMLKDDYEDI